MKLLDASGVENWPGTLVGGLAAKKGEGARAHLLPEINPCTTLVKHFFFSESCVEMTQGGKFERRGRGARLRIEGETHDRQPARRQTAVS